MIHPFLTIHICSLQKKQSSRCVQMPEACNFVKKETPTQAFSCEPCKIFKNTFFYRTPLVAQKIDRRRGFMGNRVFSKKHLTKKSSNILKSFDHNIVETNSAGWQIFEVSLNPTSSSQRHKKKYVMKFVLLSGGTHSLVLYLQVPITQ